jgi:membrane protease YdiL (CAAX protease family)
MALQAEPIYHAIGAAKMLRHPLVRLVLALLSVGIAFIAAQLALNALRMLPALGGTLSANLLALLLFVPATYGAYRAYVAKIERRAATELSRRGALAELGIGMLAGLGLFALTIGALWLLGAYRVSGMNGWSTLIAALAGAGASAFVQELLFRGILFRIVDASLGTWCALALSALLFGLIHAVSPAATLVSILAVALEAGVLFGGAYLLTRRLWLAVGIHAAWDFANDGIFGVAVSGTSGRSITGLLRAELRGPDLLTGGAFGVEASIVALVVVLTAGVLLVWRARRQGRWASPFWARGLAIDDGPSI